jgi:DNA (cytosine-5)-methyltransferase 1
MLRVGTDCSGIEAPIQALMKAGIPFHHCFSSDIDEYCRKSIKANYHPDVIYEDMCKRDVEKLPEIDLYVAGFPCQAFSAAGKRRGVEDHRGRLFWECYKVIDKRRPSVFILENVKGLLTIQGGEIFKEFIQALENLGDYTIHWKLLDTLDYGIPQQRRRLFIVGLKNREKEFTFPEKKECRPLSEYVDREDKKSQAVPPYIVRCGMMERIPKDSCFIDVGFRKNSYPNSDKYCPTLTASANMWCVPMSRYANVKELLMLQGFPEDFKRAVSNSQLKKQIGNSMSVCVLEALFRQIYS